MIDVTGIDLVEFAKVVYNLSRPIGMGCLHFTPEPLSTEEAEEIVSNHHSPGVVLSMDYVKGRGCKMVVWENDGKLGIRDSWYDHTDEQFRTLLNQFNIIVVPGEHGVACECDDCRRKRLQHTPPDPTPESEGGM